MKNISTCKKIKLKQMTVLQDGNKISMKRNSRNFLQQRFLFVLFFALQLTIANSIEQDTYANESEQQEAQINDSCALRLAKAEYEIKWMNERMVESAAACKTSAMAQEKRLTSCEGDARTLASKLNELRLRLSQQQLSGNHINSINKSDLVENWIVNVTRFLIHQVRWTIELYSVFLMLAMQRVRIVANKTLRFLEETVLKASFIKQFLYFFQTKLIPLMSADAYMPSFIGDVVNRANTEFVTCINHMRPVVTNTAATGIIISKHFLEQIVRYLDRQILSFLQNVLLDRQDFLVEYIESHPLNRLCTFIFVLFGPIVLVYVFRICLCYFFRLIIHLLFFLFSIIFYVISCSCLRRHKTYKSVKRAFKPAEGTARQIAAVNRPTQSDIYSQITEEANSGSKLKKPKNRK